MKALTFLTKLKQSKDFDGNLEYSLDEAIAELEELMKPKKISSVIGDAREQFELAKKACEKQLKRWKR